MQMSEAKRKALTIPPPRKPSPKQKAAHNRYCTSNKSIIMPDMPPYMEKAIRLRGKS